MAYSSLSKETEEGLEWLLNLDYSLNEYEDEGALSRDIYMQYASTTLDPIPKHEKTQYYLDMVWNKWLQYAKDNDLDSEIFWKDVSLDVENAKSICASFLHYYVAKSKVRRPCLGPEEWEIVQTVGSAVTVEDIWAALVRNANERILKPLRVAFQKSNPQMQSNYQDLKFGSHYNRSGTGPAYDVAKSIPALSKKLGLSLKQTFTKREFRIEDILLILDCLWVRAKHIDCWPRTRIAYHCAVLLSGFGGWRPGSLMNIKYEDVRVAWVCDPQQPKKCGIGASITIRHVKQKRDKIHRDQRSELTFSLSFMESRQICILSLMIAMALADNAFDKDYTSPEHILQRPTFEEGNYHIPLRWKPKMLQKSIMPISYQTFNKLWHKVLFVSGFRDNERIVPYSMRVGAGRRLDEKFTGPLRNFILNNTNVVYEKSYIPAHLSYDLAQAAFGKLAGTNDELIRNMSSVVTMRDENAPLYITKDDINEFNQRRDITRLRKEYDQLKGSNRKKAGLINRRLTYILERLTTLRIREIRDSYFKKVDSLRAEGKSTKHLACHNQENPRASQISSDHTVASEIGILMRQDEQNPQYLIEKLLGYLNDKPYSEVFPEFPKKGLNTSFALKRRCTCLLCNKPFTTKFNLSRHVGDCHADMFDVPFFCPECKRAEKDHQISASPFAWCHHVEKFHGKHNTPNPSIWVTGAKDDTPDSGIKKDSSKKRLRSDDAELRERVKRTRS